MDYATGLESILSDLIKRTKLRPLLERKVTKTINQLAKGERKQPYRLLLQIENHATEQLQLQCGAEFADWLNKSWEGFRSVVAIGTTELGRYGGQPQSFTDFSLETLIKHAYRDLTVGGFTGPDYVNWLECPFQSWIDYVSEAGGVQPRDIEQRLCRAFTDPAKGSDFSRTFRRWYSEAENISKLPGGHRAFVSVVTAIPNNIEDPDLVKVLDHLTSWLVLTIGFQSLSRSHRKLLMQPRSLHLSVISRPPRLYSTATVTEQSLACRYVEEITMPYREGTLFGDDLATALDDWEARAVKNILLRVQHGRLRARVLRANGADACPLYDDVVKLSAVAGWMDNEHHACLLEALGYSYQLENGRYWFEHFWDLARKSLVFVDMAEKPRPKLLEIIKVYGSVDPRRLPLAVIHKAS